tara:strand:+ start:63731 stop:64393 length:663 start_codon:yes stop_codon:yes gene_type:complete
MKNRNLNKGVFMNKLSVDTRDLGTKNKSLRKLGVIPGVIYGKTIENINVKMAMNELYAALAEEGELYQVKTASGEILVKFDEIQRDPLSRRPIHFSLLQLPRGVSSELEVPVHLNGEAIGTKSGGILVVLKDDISIKGMPKDMPDMIEGDISNLAIGDKLTVAELKLPKGIELNVEADEVVAICKPPVKAEELEISEEAGDLNPPLASEEGDSEEKKEDS